MSGIAKILLKQGFSVSGSDLKETKIIDALKKMQVRIDLIHQPENVEGVDLVIYSSAIKEDNPEIQEATRRGIPVVKRAQALAELMREKTVITVTGSHGKTTTASLISHLLISAGLKPTLAVGGILKNIDTNAYFGEGNYFVAEADESDGSFLYYQPDYSVVTNIDHEHLDYYKDFRRQVEAFKDFIQQTASGGCVFGCSDDPHIRDILKDYGNKFVLFGLKPGADIYPKNIGFCGLSSEFDCFYKDKLLGHFQLALGGEHNISNSLAVIALGQELGVDAKCIRETLATYQGTGRRMESKFKNRDYLILDDYAHHPTEIRATLAAVKRLKPRRLLAVFQPHRYTRTQLLLEEFAASFSLADYLVVTEIYPASETPLPGITGKLLYQRIKEYSPQKPVIFLAKEQISGHILDILRSGDLVITLGAGDITKISDELAEKLQRQSRVWART